LSIALEEVDGGIVEQSGALMDKLGTDIVVEEEGANKVRKVRRQKKFDWRVEKQT